MHYCTKKDGDIEEDSLFPLSYQRHEKMGIIDEENLIKTLDFTDKKFVTLKCIVENSKIITPNPKRWSEILFSKD